MAFDYPNSPTMNQNVTGPTGAVYTWDGVKWTAASQSPTGGTVTSVGLTMPAEFTVIGSPVTTSGTLAAAKANQSANLVWAGPSSGAAAAPAFRAVVSADFPAAVVGSLQTPWLQNVNAAGFTLSNVPTVSGNGNITVAAGGAGVLSLNTNAKTRLDVDSGGNVHLYGRDSDGQAALFFSTTAGASFLTSDASGNMAANAVAQMTFVAATNVLFNASGTSGTFTAQTNSKSRLLIDTTGHITINTPDSGSRSVLVAGAGIECGSDGFLCNVYWNGSAYIYRNTGTGVQLFAGGGNQPGFYAFASGSAGASASAVNMLSFTNAAMIMANQPLAMVVPPQNSSVVEPNMPNGSMVFEYNSNTTLLLRFKGFDGVFRQATLTVA